MSSGARSLKVKTSRRNISRGLINANQFVKKRKPRDEERTRQGTDYSTVAQNLQKQVAEGSIPGVVAKKRERKDKVSGKLIRNVESREVTVDRKYRSAALDRGYKEALENLVTEQPKSVNIRILSTEEIIRFGPVPVYSDLENPKTGTIFDPAFGSIDRSEVCGNSNCGNTMCSGHYGHIRLDRPIINPMFYRDLISVLTCVCWNCGQLRVPYEVALRSRPELASKSGKNRLKAYEELSQQAPICKFASSIEYTNQDTGMTETRTVECKSLINKEIDVSAPKKNYLLLKEDGTVEGESKGKKKRVKMKPDFIEQVLNSVSDEDAQILGFSPMSHPKKIITRAIVVTPLNVRVPRTIREVYTSDPMNERYRKIIQAKARKDKSEEEIDDIIFQAYNDIIFGSSDPIGDKPGAISKLSKKGGLLRTANTASVLRTLRAVIGPYVKDVSTDETIRFGEVVLPAEAAAYFRARVKVTPENIHSVEALLSANRIASYIPAKGDRAGQEIAIVPGVKIDIKVGDEVERWGQNGDYVILNRQPTLHRYGLMAAKARYIKGRRTVGMHISYIYPYNADFDGDQVTIAFMRDAKSRAEMEQLLYVTQNMTDEKDGSPNFGLVMDTLSSAFRMTPGTRGVKPEIFYQVIESIGRDINVEELQERASYYGLHPFSGRTLFSALFPHDFRYNSFKEDAEPVQIIDGILVSGITTSQELAKSSRSIIQDLEYQYNEDVASDFITEATWLLIKWSDTYGFNISASDCTIESSYRDRMSQIADRINLQVAELDEIPDKRLDPILFEAHENRVMSILDTAKVEASKLFKEYVREKGIDTDDANAIAVMIESGTKGSYEIASELSLLIGQLYYNNERPCPNDPATGRMLISQPRRDSRYEPPPVERGFCTSSLMKGVSEEEMFFGHLSGREGITSVNLATPAIGTLNRLGYKAAENIKIHTDGSVRSTQGTIYSYVYGGDGLNPSKKLAVKTPNIGKINSFLDIQLESEFLNAQAGYIRESHFNYIEKNRISADAIERELKNQIDYSTDPNELQYVDKTDNYPVGEMVKNLEEVYQEALKIEQEAEAELSSAEIPIQD